VSGVDNVEVVDDLVVDADVIDVDVNVVVVRDKDDSVTVSGVVSMGVDFDVEGRQATNVKRSIRHITT